MDRLDEETLPTEMRTSRSFYSNHEEEPIIKHSLTVPTITIQHENGQNESSDDLELESRRSSSIIAQLRRPSQAVALSAAQAIMNQRKHMLELLSSNRSVQNKEKTKKGFKNIFNSSFINAMSAIYAKLLVVSGFAIPITKSSSKIAPDGLYQGFYFYLYFFSILFIIYVYVNTFIKNPPHSKRKERNLNFKYNSNNASPAHTTRFGSFYLRLGAIAFGIGSMVHSGLEFGQYFEPTLDGTCQLHYVHGLVALMRMILVIFQIQFLFLNTKDLRMNKNFIAAKFGLMHLIAANLCVWLHLLIEETHHEMEYIAHHSHEGENLSSNSSKHEDCSQKGIMRSLVQDSSPFLFPCSIEYSLICAVILYEMWKHVKVDKPKNEPQQTSQQSTSNSNKEEKPHQRRSSMQLLHEKLQHFTFGAFGGQSLRSEQHFSVDCANVQRGLFGGILVVVLTIISLIMFFVMIKQESIASIAMFQVNIVEIFLYVSTSIAVIVAMKQMQCLKYDKRANEKSSNLGLDNILLVFAQTGTYIYCLFSMLGYYFERDLDGFVAELFSVIQTTCQTLFVLDSWWRRCRNLEQIAKKPGRELVTFLIVSNMALWSIYSLEKNRAEFRKAHAIFFGHVTWTIITHISMPLAIFYRFHSTICLFEVWKSAYKMKTPKLMLP